MYSHGYYTRRYELPYEIEFQAVIEETQEVMAICRRLKEKMEKREELVNKMLKYSREVEATQERILKRIEEIERRRENN